ncbi:MAG: integrin alpha, partial [Planctomycetota bacterium]
MRSLLLPFCAALCTVSLATAQIVRNRFALDDSIDPFERCLGALDRFGSSLASLGDLNGDGLDEFAVGASGDFRDTGSVWIFSLTNARTVQRYVKLGPRENLPGDLHANDEFGSAVVALGDLDGNGVRDLAVGAPGSDINSGAVWILYLKPNGSVLTRREISRAQGFPGDLDNGDGFGASLAAPGDLDGNEIADLIVGAPGDDDRANMGAIWILYLGPDAAVLATRKLTYPEIPLAIELGSSVAALGDLDGDGVGDLAVGGNLTIRIAFLNADESVKRVQAITSSTFTVRGDSAAALGDLDGNGVPDLAAGARVYLLSASGVPLSSQAITSTLQGFGAALAAPGDTNGDGRADLVVGSPGADTRGRDTGAITFFELTTGGLTQSPQTIDGNNGRIVSSPAPFGASDDYGKSAAPLGDLNLDGLPEVAVGAPLDDDVAQDTGAVWIHYTQGGSGRRSIKVSAKGSGLPLDALDRFGSSVAAIGDLDGNGTTELLVGAPGDDDGGDARGAAYVLFLRRTGKLERFQKISVTQGSFVPGVAVSSLGTRVEALDDLDGDGRPEVALASVQDIFVLFLAQDGTVRSSTLLDKSRLPGLTGATTTGPMAFLEGSAVDPHGVLAVIRKFPERTWGLRLGADGQIESAREFAGLLSNIVDLETLGDLDGNGYTDLAILGGQALHFQSLGSDFALLGRIRIPVKASRGLGALGDLTGDGIPDLAVGLGNSTGAVHDRVVLYGLDGVATAGFERRDALDNYLLENGRQIPRPHPGRTFVLSSEGANLGATIFDSDPLGPNQGNDLTVDSGNVMILQDSLAPTQTTTDIFDHPSDDPDGGLVALDFPRQVRTLSLELIDLDPFPNRGAEVHLVDAAGLVRNYVVPAGWTGRFGATHLRKLDLTTLDPQPGAGPYPAIAYQPPA